MQRKPIRVTRISLAMTMAYAGAAWLAITLG
jgi:hypothetical protein